MNHCKANFESAKGKTPQCKAAIRRQAILRTLMNRPMNFLWNSVRNKSFTNCPPALPSCTAWFLKIKSSSHLLLTAKVPGAVVERPGSA